MKAINLWDSKYSNKINNNTFYGPVTFYANTKGLLELRPKGLSIHYLVCINTTAQKKNPLSISINVQNSINENMYIMITEVN